MATDFSRILGLLRKEKGVSQRAAAKELGISQALMSHYETGTREPGLAFLVRACEYYGVSADYILGRTMLRDGSAISADALYDASEEKGNRLSAGSAAALLGKKLVVNSAALMFSILGRCGNKELVTEAVNYCGSALYKLFRHIYSWAGDGDEALFSLPPNEAGYLAGADMALTEAKIVRLLTENDTAEPTALPRVTHASLSEEYPALAQSLLTLLHQSEVRCSGKNRKQSKQ